VTRTARDKTPNRPPLSLMQILGLVGLIAALLIALDFNRRLAEAQRLRDSADRVGTEVAQLQKEQFALQTQMAYATTDAAIIEWAHAHGKLVQPGEVLVVPVVPTAEPTPVLPPAALPPPPPMWMLWRNLFFRRTSVP
jgi:hypothetical protein